MEENKSRVEQILSGTYVGNPLSRVEALLMQMISGGTITPSPGGESTHISSPITINESIGGLEEGKTYPVGTSIEDIIRDLTNPTLTPTLTGPSAKIVTTLPHVAKVNQVISNISVTIDFNRGKIDPQYSSSSPYRSGEANNFSLTITGADTTFADSNSTGKFVVSSITKSIKGEVNLNALASYNAGTQPKNSKGENFNTPLAAGSVSDTKTIEYILPFYRGAVTNPDDIYIEGLTEDLTKKETKTYSYATTGQYMVFAYDKDYGNLSSIKDENGFETINGWTKKVIGDYFVYIFGNATFDPDANYTFKF